MTAKLPSRLHHTAYVTKDMEATRAFYEDVLGLPLMATWCETDFLFGKDRTYCHCFFGIGDGGALAFFQFADKEDEKLFVPDMPATPFVHLALKVDEETQKEMVERIVKAGLEATYTLEHGYCRSVYVVDPNGMILDFTVDAPFSARHAARTNCTSRSKRRCLRRPASPRDTYRGYGSAPGG